MLYNIVMGTLTLICSVGVVWASWKIWKMKPMARETVLFLEPEKKKGEKK